MIKILSSFFNLFFLVAVLFGVSACNFSDVTDSVKGVSPFRVSLTEDGNYTKPMLDEDETAEIKIVTTENDWDLLDTSNLPPIGVGDFPDDTGTQTMSRGRILSESTRNWVTQGMIELGVTVPVYVNNKWRYAPWLQLNRITGLLNIPSILPEQKELVHHQIQDLVGELLVKKVRPGYITRGALSRLDRNIRTGSLGSEMAGPLDFISMNLGFKGRYQVSEMAIIFEIVDNYRGIVIHSFELSKQIISNEKSFAILGVLTGVLSGSNGDEDLTVKATPKIRAAEPLQKAQRMMVKEGTYLALQWLVEHHQPLNVF